jgi:hypothetical protein
MTENPNPDARNRHRSFARGAAADR